MIRETDQKIRAAVRVTAGLEEGPRGATHVHALEIPGCMATGASPAEALAAFEKELVAWLEFLIQAGEPVVAPEGDIDITIDEWLATEADVASGETDVCFAADRVPLTREETAHCIRLLGDLRGRLVPRIRRLRNEDLATLTLDGLNARTVLEELAREQWWTLTRLGASPLAAVPDRVVARLDTAMALTVDRLTGLEGNALESSLTLDGEEWTPRKVLRRLLWLEWTLGSVAIRILDASPASVTPS